MPYESKAQAAYMHIHHPDIAADWKSKGHGYVKRHKVNGKLQKVQRKSDVSKASKKEWAVGLGTATIGGALANQVPPVKIRRKKKGKVAKLHAPVRKDGWYNQRAADQMFDLIMKMDDDTAQVFSYIVCSDIFETTVENNLGTIQKALNQIFDRRMEMVKKALVRVAQTTDDPRVVEYAKAVRQVEEFSKAVGRNPQYYGYTWKESDFKRDPGTGRFAVKVHHTMKKPLPKKQAMAVIGSHGKGMNDKQRARYQDEYRQVAAFLAGVQGVGGAGNNDIIYHLKDSAGNHFTRMDPSGDMPEDMLSNPDTELVAMEAKPTTLTAGGAAYGLAGGLTGDQVNRFDTAFSSDTGVGIHQMTSQLGTAGSEQDMSNRVFGRLSATGTFANQVAPAGSKIQIAGKMAEIVGEFGPEAEKVIGPSTRKTAYRYRGTEKAPEKPLVRGYAAQIADAKRYGVVEEEVDQRLLGFGTQREPGRGDILPFGQRRAVGARERRPEQVAPAVGQMAQAQALQTARKPTWAERGAGAARVADYLRLKLPDKHLYRLHLQAGNTPPSEGVIINSDGQLAVQAVGYGDDHYLPFNLKNLKALKGGEYIRNRSVGGLTSEDVYTGLMMGARRVTVVSRSGTFTMEFEEDFRGGRRHNDKALRMTRRYEQILDAVQSGQVDRATIPPAWRKAIRREVEEEYPDNTPKAIIREETDRREKEFKEKPDIEGRDLERAEAMISDMEARAAMGQIPEQDAAAFRTQVMNELHNMKEVRFRLNGVGYEAGLKSLQEQFPYYIKSVKTNPTKDEELLEFELDEGYVEPGRNRPTGARAGLYGTGLDPNTKYSAALASYQRGRAGRGAFKPAQAAVAAAPGTGLSAGPGRGAAAPGDATGQGLTAGPGRGEAEPKDASELGFKAGPGRGQGAEEGGKSKEGQKARDELARTHKQRNAKKVAREIRDDLKLNEIYWDENKTPEWWSLTDDQFDDWIRSPEHMNTFDKDMANMAPKWSKADSGLPHFGGLYARFQEARGAVKEVKYNSSNAGNFPLVPYSFADLESKDAYHVGASYAEVKAAMTVVDNKDTAVLFTSTKKLSELSTSEMRDEVDATNDLRQAATKASPEAVLAAFNQQQQTQTHPTERLIPMLKTQAKVDEHLEQVHRMRYLKEMLKTAKNVPPGAGTSAGFQAGGSSGGGSSGGSSGGTFKPLPNGPEPKPLVPDTSGVTVPDTIESITSTPPAPEPEESGLGDVALKHRPNGRQEYLDRTKSAIFEIRRELNNPSTPPEKKAIHTEDIRSLEQFSGTLERTRDDDWDVMNTAFKALNDRQKFRVALRPQPRPS